MNAPLLQIGGGGKETVSGKRSHDTLSKIAMRAVELGRTKVAVEAIRGITRIGAPPPVTISECNFSGSSSPPRRGRV